MATKRENTPLNKWTHPPSLWRRLLETKRPHEYRIQWMVDRTYYISDCSLYVSSLRTVQQKTEPLFTCKNIRETCCSCRLRVSPLKQETHKTRNHFWLNPQLPQNHHYPNAQRRKRGERTQTLEGVRLEAALSFFLGRGKIKFHQHAESQHHGS